MHLCIRVVKQNHGVFGALEVPEIRAIGNLDLDPSTDLHLWESRPRVYGLVGRLLSPIASTRDWNVEFLAGLAQCNIRDSELLRECPHRHHPDSVVEFLAVVTGHQSRGYGVVNAVSTS